MAEQQAPNILLANLKDLSLAQTEKIGSGRRRVKIFYLSMPEMSFTLQRKVRLFFLADEQEERIELPA